MRCESLKMSQLRQIHNHVTLLSLPQPSFPETRGVGSNWIWHWKSKMCLFQIGRFNFFFFTPKFYELICFLQVPYGNIRQTLLITSKIITYNSVFDGTWKYHIRLMRFTETLKQDLEVKHEICGWGIATNQQSWNNSIISLIVKGQ